MKKLGLVGFAILFGLVKCSLPNRNNPLDAQAVNYAPPYANPSINTNYPFINTNTTSLASTNSAATLFVSDDSSGVQFELGGIAYDSVNNLLYWVGSASSSSWNDAIVRRYNVSSGLLDTAISLTGAELCYGLRVFNQQLWVCSRSSQKIYILKSVSSGTLDLVGALSPTNSDTGRMNELNDVASIDARAFFVSGNFLTSAQHNGIQYLSHPAYRFFTDLISSASSGWPDPSYSYTRNIVSLFSGPQLRLIVSTGQGVIASYDGSGNLDTSITGGSSGLFLQSDSLQNIYAMGSGNTIKRWNSSLANQISFTLTGLPNFYDIFAIKETAGTIELFIAEYRTSSPKIYLKAISRL